MPIYRWLLAVPVIVSGTTSVLATPVLATFDGFDASGGDVPIVSPYLGLNWRSFTAYTTTPGFEGFNNGIVSQANAAYSGGETSSGNGVAPIVGSITAPTLFDFISADLGAGYYGNLSLSVQGIRGGSLLFTRNVTLGTTGAQLINFGFSDIDTLNFVASTTAQTTDPFACGGFDCTQFTLDNVSLNLSDVVTPPSGIPEPDTVSLLLAACLAAFGVRQQVRRRRSPG